MTEIVYIFGKSNAGDARCLPISSAVDGAGADTTKVIRQAVYGSDLAGSVVVAIPSSWCLCAPIRTSDLPPKDQWRAMLYRLEEKIPVAAEEIVADFVPGAAGALGVCVVRARLQPLIDGLRERGVRIAAVCPDSLLVLQHRLESATGGQAGSESHGIAGSDDAIVMLSEGRLELFRMEGGRPSGWSVFSDDPAELLLHLKLEAFNGGASAGQVTALGLPEQISSALASTEARVSAAPAAHLPDEAVPLAARILAGQAEPWINLRDSPRWQDRLRTVGAPLQYAAAAVMICLLSACGAALWRAARYDRLADRYAREERAVFQRTFPRQPEPADVRSRLDSEERGLRGLSGDSTAPPPQTPGVVALRDVLGGLPAGLRFRLLEMRLDGIQFTLEGQAGSHGDADGIATALRAIPGFAVEPPRTEQLSGGRDTGGQNDGASTVAAETGVAFTITGTVGPGAVARGDER